MRHSASISPRLGSEDAGLRHFKEETVKNKIRTAAFAACLALCAGAAGAEGLNLKNLTWGEWKTGFGLQDRLRVEQKQNFNLNDDVYDNGGLVFHRIRVNGRMTYKEKYEIFAEGLDGRVYSAHIKPTAQTNSFDLHQGYVRANNIAGLPVDLKAGRQELKYGKGRLLWAATWANRINRFDAAVAHYKNEGFYADLIYGSRVRYFDHSFDEGNKHDILTGTYMGWQKTKTSPLIEGYFLTNLDQGKIRTEDGIVRKFVRHTAGLRAQAAMPGDIVCEVEVPYQFGRDGSSDISAYAIHADAGRTFTGAWKPGVNVAYNFASGDKTPGNRLHTFVPLYQSTHEPYGLMDFFRWQNMKEAALEVSLNPVSRLKLISAASFFWLDSYRDYWYDSSGARLRFKSKGKADNYVGQETSLVAKYDLSDTVKLDAGYAHFFSGDYVGDTGARDDADWFYLQAVLKL